MSSASVLRHYLEEELAAESKRRELTRLGRLCWLARHTEEFVDRFLGFYALPHTTIPALIESDFFKMISVAAELMNGEFTHINTTLEAKHLWHAFLRELATTANQSRKGDPSRLMITIQEVRIALESHSPDS